ncbi:MAG: enoyl-CoA hydratase/isomerase family protein [Gammaproteobacteria bacterium]
MADLVLREDDEGIAVLTLNRPDQLNALSPEVFLELQSHLESIAAAVETIGCVILRANGRAFSAGADLKARWSGKRHPAADTIDFMEALPQPVIAQVHGYCFTGGVELALGADLIVAADTATFSDTHGKWGLVAGWGQTQRLPRRIGPMKAKEMIYTGRRYTAAESQAMGLVAMVFPAAELEQSTRALAREMLANSWHSLRGHKLLINQGLDRTYSDALRYAIENNPGVAPDRDARVRAGGFVRRDPPRDG